MKAMQLVRKGQPLQQVELPIPTPSASEVLIKVSTCGVCRTDVHIVDGELPDLSYPSIPGHQIVGTIVKLGDKVTNFKVGDRVGVGWLGWTCGKCQFCLGYQENLCEKAKFTGKDINGGFAEYCIANADYCLRIPEIYDEISAAPLLCAGLIGYRAYKALGETDIIGFYGFGSSAHILIQIAKAQKKQCFVFTRRGDTEGQNLAKNLGADWVGSSSDIPPQLMDGAIIFAPVGELVPQALKVTTKGGTVVCAGIHMSDIPSFPYGILWGEKIIKSIANTTRANGVEFMRLAQKIPLQLNITSYKLDELNHAIADIRRSKINGSAVVVMDNP